MSAFRTLPFPAMIYIIACFWCRNFFLQKFCNSLTMHLVQTSENFCYKLKSYITFLIQFWLGQLSFLVFYKKFQKFSYKTTQAIPCPQSNLHQLKWCFTFLQRHNFSFYKCITLLLGFHSAIPCINWPEIFLCDTLGSRFNKLYYLI